MLWYPHGKLATTAMWLVGCISGLIFLVKVSAGMHISGNKDPLRLLDRVQLQAEEIEPEFNHHHHIQDIEKASSLIFTEHVPYNCMESYRFM